MGFKVFFCQHAFFVLFWKHIIERSRRVAHTIFEIFCGVFIFIVLVCIKQDIASFLDTTSNSMLHLNESWAEVSVLYTPNTERVNDLIYKLAINLQGSNSNIGNATDRVLYISSYRGFDTEKELVDYVTSLDHPEPTFIISFKNNMLGPHIPLNLNYTIAFTDFKSKGMHKNLYMEIPSATVEGSTALASFQWNVDKAFMETLSGEPIAEDVVMFHEYESAPELKMTHNFLVISTLLGPLSFYMFTASKLVIEKRAGLKELMRLHGVSPTVLRISHVFEAFFMGIIYSIVVTILLKVTSKPVLTHSNPVYVFITLMLHLLNVTSFALVASSLSQDYQHSDSTAFLMYIFTCILDFMWYKKIQNKAFIYIICCILPHSPIHLFWGEVFYLESVGLGAGFSEMFTMHSEKCTPIVTIWVFFVVQLIVLNLLAWYLDLVRPGKYGVAAEWNFFCKRRFWCRKKKQVTFHVTVEAKTQLLRDDRYFQKPSKKAELAIKTVGVTKEYVHSRKHKLTALDSVSLDALKGEITIILGTNGAGKTTLMSIIAGMTSATKGSVYVNGLDTSSRLQEIRRDLGLCPQTDHTFKYLTVRENVTFFLRLKKRVANEEHSAETLLSKLNLVKKANYYDYQLSSGMRRCLQLACALVGDADVLVLDEPTTGMDTPTMHSVWDILMVLRGPKTIIMTTMIMEEADALADRIALLHHGKLKCYGSPTFLKEALGNQINLDIALQPKNNVNDVKKIILEQVPEASFVQLDHNILTYRMSSKAKEKLPALFDRLEASQEELGITTMEIGMSMEEIFLRFIEGNEEHLIFYTDQNDMSDDFRIHGWRLWRKQLRILTKRTYVYFMTKKLQFIILQIVVPLFAIILVTLSANSSFGYGEYYSLPADKAKLTMVYDMGPFKRGHMFDEVNYLRDIRPIKSDDVKEEIKKRINAHEHLSEADQVFGYTMEKNRSLLFHATHDYPLVTRAVNAFSNIFMAIHVPFARNSSIETSYQPIHLRSSKSKKIVKPKALMLCMTWAMWVAFFASLPLVPFIQFPIKEFHNGARYNLLLSGCSPVLIWSSKLLAHFSTYIFVIVPCIIAIIAIFDFDKTLCELEFLLSVFLMLAVFGLAFLTQLYVLSYFLYVEHAVAQMYVTSLVLGLVTPVFINHMIVRIQSHPEMALVIILILIFPSITFSVGLVTTSTKARANAYCHLNRHLCPNDLFDDVHFSKDVCCDSTAANPFKYFAFSAELSTGQTIIVLFLHFIVQFSLLLLLQNRVLQSIGEKISHFRYKVPRQLYYHKKVTKEIKDIKNKMDLLRTKPFKDRWPIIENNALIVENLHKHYTAFCGDSFRAVKGVSFEVKKGECLGILGPNGAGKTTTLKMVAGFTVMTRGDCNVGGYFLKKERHKYLRNIAFSRERAGFDYFLSGYENLALMSNLYGRPEHLTRKMVLRCLGYMGLQAYSEMKVKSYSVGCFRRLAVCANLLAEPTAGLLDEPTVSVDPYTKPLVVRAIKHLRKMGTACVVAEAGMGWHLMECICSRIAIMCRGQFAAIGTAAEIRAQFGSGYTATIKLRPNTAFTVGADDTVTVFKSFSLRSLQSIHSLRSIGSSKSSHSIKSVYSVKSAVATTAVEDLKFEFEEMFETSILREEHLTMLYYHIQIDGEIKYSEMFNKLETLKNKYDDVVEDYTLSPASIEDVFRKLENRLADIG